jgi:hypothetical protein
MVDQVNDVPRSRRAVLTAAAAAGAATVAGALIKPLPALGAVDDNADMFVGTTYGDVSLQTGLVNHTNAATVFAASSSTGGIGLYGSTNNNIGTFGGGGLNGRGVVGAGTNNYGVHGTSTNSIGVRAESTGSWGLYATSGSGTAAYIESTSGPGAVIVSHSATAASVLGWGHSGSTGVQGYAGDTLDSPAARASTGVMGTASGSGTGGYFKSESGNALRVEGKASFSRAGRVSVPINRSYVDITVAGGLASTAAIVATLQVPRGTCTVTSVRVNYPSAGKARIYLSKVASTTATTPVGYFVIG